MLGFDVPTFVFQIINFLILLAILARFFYRPVLDMMNKRQETIDARISDAEERARKADEERTALAQQSVKAQQEARALIETAQIDAAKERARLLEAARAEAASLIEQARKTATAEQHAAFERVSHQVSQSAVNIAAALIRGTSGEAVHASLIDQLLSDELGLDGQALETAQQDGSPGAGVLLVESAYPLDAALQQTLRERAAKRLGRAAAGPAYRGLRGPVADRRRAHRGRRDGGRHERQTHARAARCRHGRQRLVQWSVASSRCCSRWRLGPAPCP